MYQGESADEVPPITERVDKREHVQDFHPKELIRRKKNVDSNWETRPETTEALGESSMREAYNQSRFLSFYIEGILNVIVKVFVTYLYIFI